MNTKTTFKKAIIAGILAALSSAIINSLLFVIFKTVGVISESIFIQPGQPMTLFPVIVASLLPSFIGAFIFFLIDKFTRNGYKVFSLISIILLVLSFANPFMVISGVTIPYAVVLNVMHVVVAGSLLYFLKRTNK